jgi:hypothetical protein
MTQLGFLPYLNEVVKRHQEEIIAQIYRNRFLEEALRVNAPKTHKQSKIMAFLGKELATLGLNLESRYSNQPERSKILSQQNNPGGCS